MMGSKGIIDFSELDLIPCVLCVCVELIGFAAGTSLPPCSRALCEQSGHRDTATRKSHRKVADDVLVQHFPGSIAVPNLLKVLCGVLACKATE